MPGESKTHDLFTEASINTLPRLCEPSRGRTASKALTTANPGAVFTDERWSLKQRRGSPARIQAAVPPTVRPDNFSVG